MLSSSLNYGEPLVLLSRLLISPASAEEILPSAPPTPEQFRALSEAANQNHVIVRGLRKYRAWAQSAGHQDVAEWAGQALAQEDSRIAQALRGLDEVCRGLEAEGFEVVVVKSLDHWPDIGSDLDMFTMAPAAAVSEAMVRRFQAQAEPRSWGDRLAGKRNFRIPGLRESVEIHIGKLGQTGEQTPLAETVVGRAQRVSIGAYRFPVPCPSDRLMISTLQRMYRHFYFRLCDIVDTQALSAAGAIDYDDLRRQAVSAGIWEGVAAYLAIVSDFLEHCAAAGLPLPASVKADATIGGNEVYIANGFIRVPILPQSARLYTMQLAGLLRNREIQNGARLSLLPWLAAAAAVKQKITGSDKGIW